MFPSIAAETPPAPDIGRRERKKFQTRVGLMQAAIELFAERGYDNTTIGDITEAADVSPRTFFRHFSSKEDVLFPTPDDGPFLARVRDQPVRVNDIDAVRDAYLAMLPLSPEQVRRVLLLKKAMLAAPPLEGRNLIVQRRFRDHIAQALADRRGLDVPDDPAIIAASVAQTVMQLAFDRWAEVDGRADLSALLRDHFALVGHVMQPATTSSHGHR